MVENSTLEGHEPRSKFGSCPTTSTGHLDHSGGQTRTTGTTIPRGWQGYLTLATKPLRSFFMKTSNHTHHPSGVYQTLIGCMAMFFASSSIHGRNGLGRSVCQCRRRQPDAQLATNMHVGVGHAFFMIGILLLASRKFSLHAGIDVAKRGGPWTHRLPHRQKILVAAMFVEVMNMVGTRSERTDELQHRNDVEAEKKSKFFEVRFWDRNDIIDELLQALRQAQRSAQS